MRYLLEHTFDKIERPKATYIVEISLEFEPKDLWIGAYVNRWTLGLDTMFSIWVCILPCLPIHLVIGKYKL